MAGTFVEKLKDRCEDCCCRRDNRLERLRTKGIGEEDLARIRSPVGLSIGAKGPAEIAVSIIAEIVKASRGGL